MSSFNETTIIECNRLSSEEGKTQNNQNPALYTNKVGSGIKVNQGDTVSVFSAFISEKGAGGETIQFAGKTLTDRLGNPLTKNLMKTSISTSSACFMIPISNNEEFAIKNADPLLITATQEENKYILKDNEVNLKICYYKTINGESCVALPRRFMSSISGLNETRNTQWKMEDSFLEGLPHKGIFLENGGVPALTGRLSPNGLDTGFAQRFFVEDDYRFKLQASSSMAVGTNRDYSYYKLKTDNSRYKLFMSTETRKAGYGKLTTPDEDMDWFKFNELSEQNYIPYEEVLTLTAPIGFSSPESIANILTDQMRETGEITDNYFYNLNGSNFGAGAPVKTPQEVKRNMSTYNESKTYKTFSALSVNDSNASTYWSFENGCFLGNNGEEPPNLKDIPQSRWYYNQYLSGTQFIGIKRPDFYEKGIALQKVLPKHSYTDTTTNTFCHLDEDINTQTTGSNPTLTASLVLAHEWTPANLLAWKEWLDTQGNYPELFVNDNNSYQGRTTPENSRFFHMNLNQNQLQVLGGDNCSSVAFNVLTQRATPNASSFNTVPVFFDFVPSASNTFTEGQEGNPCYGFAYKHLSSNGSYVITMATNEINNPLNWKFQGKIAYQIPGIPYEYSYYSSSAGASGYDDNLIVGNYQSTGGTLNNQPGRLIGFDKHWNAFGNSMIGLSDGYLNSNYSLSTFYGINTMEVDTLQESNALLDSTPFAKKIYVGAQEPKFEFSASNSKFNIQQLHTPEYIGNLWNAGIISASAELNTTSNPDAQEKVYKINKRLDNSNWTTDMLPYSQNNISNVESIYPGGINANAKFSLSLKNDMIEPWRVFDTQSGIIIEDFGMTEDAWGRSLWASLGFSYNQFSGSQNASFNLNTILNETNSSRTPLGFTNADLNVGDTINYVKNIWGAPLITPQVPLPMLFNAATTAGESPPFITNRFYSIYPAITESQNSIQLIAEDLPTKMTRAYFTIRTDLLENSTYLGSRDSGEALKTISVVNKINGFGDYYFQQDNPLVFTVTQPKTITSITTQIAEPDGSTAQINLDSCVMYKIERAINSTLNPVQELLQSTNAKI